MPRFVITYTECMERDRQVSIFADTEDDACDRFCTPDDNDYDLPIDIEERVEKIRIRNVEKKDD